MRSRRDVLQMAAWLSTSAALPAALAAGRPGTLLILGGIGFIGPHLTQEAQRRGWKVTHFNRGKTAADGVPGVETLLGDRKGKIDALRGRKCDAVVDDTGYIPKYVRMSAQLLAPNVGYCLFISSISVYASFARPNDEHSATGTLADPQIEEITDTTYGPRRRRDCVRVRWRTPCAIRSPGSRRCPRSARGSYAPGSIRNGRRIRCKPGIARRLRRPAKVGSFERHVLLRQFLFRARVLRQVRKAHATQHVGRLGELDVVVTDDLHAVAPGIAEIKERTIEQANARCLERLAGRRLIVDD